jgi:high affinity sulfate transporter 1
MRDLIARKEGSVIFGVPDWLVSYRRDWVRLDVLAGLTVAAVVVPKAMAYASIAGLPVQVGLYTAFLPMIVYALLGTSRVLSVSTTTTIAILTSAQLTEASSRADPASLLAATATLTLLVGGMLVIASVLRLGFLANFISEPVLIGFKAAIGVVIIIDQIPKILGIHVAHGSFFHSILAIVRGLSDTSLPTFAVGISMIAILVLLEHVAPKVPAPLVVVVLGIAAVSLLGLQTRGVSLIGHIPKGLPSILIPNMSLAQRLWPGALGIALMSFTETIAAGRAFVRSGEPTPKANRELLATGLANAGGAFFGAMPGGGGTTQTAVNRLAGAKTQLSEIVTAATTLVTMLLLAPFISKMPQATLAAIVIVYSIGLIKPKEFREILNVRRTEFIWAITAFGSVVLLGTLKGIVVAIIVSLIALAYQIADPPVYVLGRKPGTNVFRPRSKEHPEDESFPGLLLLRPEGRVFFANAEHIGQKMRRAIQEYRPSVALIDLSGIPDLEYTALKMLAEAQKKQREEGVSVWLVGANPGVLEMIRRCALGQVLGREALHFNIETAVAKFQQASARAIA